MPDADRPPDLEIDQDLRWERRYIRVQVVSWVIMALIIGAALAGLMGAGPLSTTTVASPHRSLVVQYQRVLRYEEPVAFTIILTPPRHASRVQLWIDNELLRPYQVASIAPQPRSSSAGKGRTRYTFAIRNTDHVVINFRLITMEEGYYRGRVGVSGGESVALWQFIYP